MDRGSTQNWRRTEEGKRAAHSRGPGGKTKKWFARYEYRQHRACFVQYFAKKNASQRGFLARRVRKREAKPRKREQNSSSGNPIEKSIQRSVRAGYSIIDLTTHGQFPQWGDVIAHGGVIIGAYTFGMRHDAFAALHIHECKKPSPSSSNSMGSSTWNK
jgi:hypothetical protein